ncbi:hypothetical protein C8R44DRAFT_846343 [Mycena epipterygia]|nr:hypothetical protein C8R44DRAFT_846343 [Mycena epipterygia]
MKQGAGRTLGKAMGEIRERGGMSRVVKEVRMKCMPRVQYEIRREQGNRNRPAHSRRRKNQEKNTNLTAPAAALSLNNVRASFHAAFPASAIRCTPNGAGASKSHDSKCACAACAMGVSGGKEGRVGSEGGSKSRGRSATVSSRRYTDMKRKDIGKAPLGDGG